jgi:hypothetical protein
MLSCVEWLADRHCEPLRRSNPSSPRKRSWIASSQGLLAKTSPNCRHTTLSQICVRDLAAPCARGLPENSLPSNERAQGGRAPDAPDSRVCNDCGRTHTRWSGHTGITGTPRAMVYGLFRALPGDRAFLPPSPALLSANLTPASGRQDHTTSPSASAPFVKGAAASTASRPASVTIAKRPSDGAGRQAYTTDLGPAARKISEIQNLIQMAGGGQRKDGLGRRDLPRLMIASGVEID